MMDNATWIYLLAIFYALQLSKQGVLILISHSPLVEIMIACDTFLDTAFPSTFSKEKKLTNVSLTAQKCVKPHDLYSHFSYNKSS